MKALSSLLVAGLGIAPLAQAQSAAPVGRLPPDVTPTHYRMMLRVDPRADSFSGETTIEVKVNAPGKTIWLHGLGLNVTEATVSFGSQRVPAHYEEVEHDFGVARIVTNAPIPAGPATLSFKYTAPFRTSAQGLYHTKEGNDWYAFSQMEAIDARRAFPGFDEPGFKTPFDITILARSGDQVITNTPEARAAPLKDGWVRHEFQTTRPLPTYLLAFAVGPLEIVNAAPIAANSVRSTPLPLRIVAAKGQGPRMQYAAREAPKLVERLEEYFGIPFPYPKLDLIASPDEGGAMENAGAIIFDESLLLFSEHPTAAQQSLFGDVAAHEMAHQWFGDLVTPAWWDDIWLNESFAEWMGVKISDAWHSDLGIKTGQLVQTLRAMDTDALRVGRQIHEPITSNAQISSGFDDITYEKGAGVLGMIESYLGEERFQNGVRLHLRRHAYGNATASDFFAAMAEGSGDPKVVEAFRSFVDQAGVPLITVKESADERALTLEQSRFHPLGSQGADSQLWKVPLCVDVIAGARSEKRCTLLEGRTGTLALGGKGAGAVVHPNAEGAGYYRFALDPRAFKSLLEVTPRLPAREALVFADSAGAAFDAGKLPFPELLSAAGVLAKHPERNAAVSLGRKLMTIHDTLASAADRPAIERRLVAIYKPGLVAVGYDPAAGRYAGDSSEKQLLRQSLTRLVALGGRDAEVRAVLAKAAERSLSDSHALDPSLRATAWSVAVQESGKPFADKLESLVFTTPDPHVRQDAVSALGRAETGSVAEQARGLLLDKRVDITTVLSVLVIQMNDPVTRPEAWSWLEKNRDAVFERMPAMFQSNLAHLGSPLCSNAGRQQFDSVLGSRLTKVSGGELEVRRTRETIDDCIALQAATGSQIASALAAGGGRSGK